MSVAQEKFINVGILDACMVSKSNTDKVVTDS